MTSTYAYYDVKSSSALGLETPAVTVRHVSSSNPTNMHAQAHLIYIDPVADVEEGEVEWEWQIQNRNEPSILSSLNGICLCFNVPCGILGAFLFTLFTLIVFFCTSLVNVRA